MVDIDDADSVRLVRETNTTEQGRLRPLSTFRRTYSAISLDTGNVSPKQVFDVLNQIYDDRTHRKCLLTSFFTLISMTLAIVSWMTYWLVYNRSENAVDEHVRNSLYNVATFLETLTFILLGTTPVLFMTMIILWIRYSCYNPMESIREDGKLIRIEDEQWRKQMNYFYRQKPCRFFNCFNSKQRKELDERGYGFIILSSHGIVIDELLLLSARRNLIDHAILSDYGRLLDITFKRTCSSPIRFHVQIYLSECLNNRDDFAQLKQLLQIHDDDDHVENQF